MTTQPDPAEGIRAHREAMAKNAALLRKNMANVDANGNPVAANTSRAPYMAVVTSGDVRKIGEMTDHLLDRIQQLEANQKDV